MKHNEAMFEPLTFWLLTSSSLMRGNSPEQTWEYK